METLTVIIYVVIFISGSVFGSFFSLAIYRLPRKENIMYVRSHCTKCNHELNFLDLIPIWSYIFLGGKCHYCKEKIRSRYILLEIFSGLLFLLIALSVNISAYSTLHQFTNLFFIYLFLCVIFIVGGIDKETMQIHDGTLLYGIVVSLIYNLFNLFCFSKSMKYELLGFIIIPTVFLTINAVIYCLKKSEANFSQVKSIGFGDIKYIATLGLFMGFSRILISIIFATMIGVIFNIFDKKAEIPFGYYLSISAAIVLLISPMITDITDLINVTMF